jgi:hypothetical protein
MASMSSRRQVAHPRVVGALGVVVAGGVTEHGGARNPGRVLRIRVRPAEPVIGEERPHLPISGEQPRVVTGRGQHLADRPFRGQSSQGRGDIQNIFAMERHALTSFAFRHDVSLLRSIDRYGRAPIE